MTKTFHLVITETVPNEDYEAQAKAYDDRSRWAQQPTMDAGYPSKDRTIKVLEVRVTENEFAAIKRAALETMS